MYFVLNCSFYKHVYFAVWKKTIQLHIPLKKEFHNFTKKKKQHDTYISNPLTIKLNWPK